MREKAQEQDTHRMGKVFYIPHILLFLFRVLVIIIVIRLYGIAVFIVFSDKPAETVVFIPDDIARDIP